MTTLVTGSRFDVEAEPERTAFVIDILLNHIPPDELVLVGDARGVDQVTTETLWDRNRVIPFEAKWREHDDVCWCRDKSPGSVCKRAGHRRNEVMLDQRPNRVVALWDGKSPGTRNTIKGAEKRGIPVERYRLP